MQYAYNSDAKGLSWGWLSGMIVEKLKSPPSYGDILAKNVQQSEENTINRALDLVLLNLKQKYFMDLIAMKSFMILPKLPDRIDYRVSYKLRYVRITQ